MNEMQLNKIKKRADEYATSYFPYEKQFLEREAVVKCCVHVVTETIAELETENADLKEEVNKIAFARGNLEKENAELKKQLEMSNKVYNDNLDYSHHIEEQLTKAKEIIKDLLNLPFANNEEVFADVGSHLYEAEQFLKDLEK